MDSHLKSNYSDCDLDGLAYEGVPTKPSSWRRSRIICGAGIAFALVLSTLAFKLTARPQSILESLPQFQSLQEPQPSLKDFSSDLEGDGEPYICHYQHRPAQGGSYSENIRLPADAPEHYFVSNSPRINGTVEFTTHASQDDGADLVLTTWDVHSIEDGCPVNVCLMKNKAGGVGVALFVRCLALLSSCCLNTSSHDHSSFTSTGNGATNCNLIDTHATVRAVISFPSSRTTASPRRYERLRSVMATISQTVDLDFGTFFGNAEVDSSYDAVTVHSVNMAEGGFGSLTAPITVKATVADGMQLYTQHGPIVANITILGAGNGRPTDRGLRTFDIHGGLGPVDATVTLQGVHPNPDALQYRIFVTNNNAPASIRMPSIPADANVELNVINMEGRAELTLDSAWEGYFELYSDSTPPIVNVRPGAEDPQHKQPPRPRNVTFLNESDSESVLGTAVWGEGRKNLQGAVWVGPWPGTPSGEIVLNI